MCSYCQYCGKERLSNRVTCGGIECNKQRKAEYQRRRYAEIAKTKSDKPTEYVDCCICGKRAVKERNYQVTCGSEECKRKNAAKGQGKGHDLESPEVKFMNKFLLRPVMNH